MLTLKKKEKKTMILVNMRMKRTTLPRELTLRTTNYPNLLHCKNSIKSMQTEYLPTYKTELLLL